MSPDLSPLPGAPARPGDSVADIATPALVLELDAYERNLRMMADAVRGTGVALRPHAKAHKCAEIARAQVALGAVGVCCQTVGEAEVMADAGIADVLVTNEVVGRAWLLRLARLARKTRVAVLADDAGNVADLAAAAAAAGVTLTVLVEVDVGGHRCGVAPGAAAAELAKIIAAAPALEFGGIHAYHGPAQHRRTPDERAQAIAAAAALANESRLAIEAAGIECRRITGGGTGTWTLERESGVYTELQPGSYVFMDADYGRNTRAPGEPGFAQSLYVLASVMSRAGEGRVVVDAGLKSLAFDSGPPLVHRVAGCLYEKASDEHGVVAIAAGAARPALGERLWLVPGHCDPTVNLHDWIVGVRHERVESVWAVAARGH